MAECDQFIYENLDEIGIRNINFILPVIQEWNQRNKVGETTRLSSLIALKYYQWTVDEDVYLSERDNEKIFCIRFFMGRP